MTREEFEKKTGYAVEIYVMHVRYYNADFIDEYLKELNASRDSRMLSAVPSEWKKYPDEKPTERDRYRVIERQFVDGKFYNYEVHAIYSRIEDEFYYEGIKILHPIAWMPIPEYKS